MAEPANKRKSSMTPATRVLLGLTLLGGVVFVGSIGAAIWAVSRIDKGDVKEGSFLRINVGELADAPGPAPLFMDPADLPPVNTEVARAIRKAATDERIQGVFLDIGGGGGWALTEELRTALSEFRAAGKPCVAYSTGYETRDYYLASVCDKVVVAPSGITMVAGLSTEITYYSGTFEKIGVSPQFEHVGNFKSAVEPYERTGPSDGAMEAYNTLLDGIWTRFVTDVAESRGKTKEEIQALVDQPPMSPEDALAAGLVDAVAFPDAVEATLGSLKDADWAAKLAEVTKPATDEEREGRFTPVDEYVKSIIADDAGKDAQIAVIYADGPIVSGSGEQGMFAEPMLADGPFAEWMDAARTDDSVKAVVLRVNSPGGSGLASDMMWREVELTQAIGKPVVVSMGDYAASGGYYISCSADWVVAQPLTLTGSIGVFGGKFALAGTYEKIGITEYQFKRGALADIFSASQPFSEEGRAAFKGYLEDFYSVFVNRVADGRGKTFDEIHEVAQGRVWTGEQALERGLVDELGGLDVAVKKAAELAKIEDYGLRKLPAAKTFFEVLAEDLEKASGPTIEITPIPGAEEAVRELVTLDRILADNGVAAYLPGDLDVR